MNIKTPKFNTSWTVSGHWSYSANKFRFSVPIPRQFKESTIIITDIKITKHLETFEIIGEYKPCPECEEKRVELLE